MLESIRKGQRWLTLLLVIFIGAVFVLFMGVGGSLSPSTPTGTAIVELGDFRVQMTDYQRLRIRQEEVYRERMGEGFDARTFGPFLDAQTLRTLVESVVLAQSARDLGLGVSREEVQQLVRQSPAFRDESGQFNLDAFRNYAEYEFGNQMNFLESVRQDLLRQKMVGLLYGQATLSDLEARNVALHDLEEIRIGYVVLDTESLPPGEELDEEVLDAYREANRESLKIRYDADIESYNEPERARASHILIRLSQDADEETVAAARTAALEVRTRIEAGEAFSDVAREISDDPGSRQSGGDLGLFRKGHNAAAIDEAIFSLEASQISEPVRSPAGFHVIQVSERIPEGIRPFEEVSAELARADAITEAAQERTRKLLEELRADLDAGMSLESAASSRSVSLERSSTLNRRPDGFVPGLGAAPGLLSQAFSLDLESPSSSTVYEIGSQRVLIQLLERDEPSEEEIEEVASERRGELLTAKRNRLVQEWVAEKQREFEESGRLLVNAELVISDS
jgi:peptidyl-prolyl cis-trans isomerase D